VRVRILLQTAPDDGAFGEAEEVATFEKGADRLEEVGLSLAEGEAVLAALQRRTVELQAVAWIERQRHCTDCGKQLRIKGGYPIVFRSLFGDVRLASPRFHRCRCRNQAGPTTVSSLKDLFSDHTASARAAAICAPVANSRQCSTCSRTSASCSRNSTISSSDSSSTDGAVSVPVGNVINSLPSFPRLDCKRPRRASARTASTDLPRRLAAVGTSMTGA
jgi:hypothetical protein